MQNHYLQHLEQPWQLLRMKQYDFEPLSLQIPPHSKQHQVVDAPEHPHLVGKMRD